MPSLVNSIEPCFAEMSFSVYSYSCFYYTFSCRSNVTNNKQRLFLPIPNATLEIKLDIKIVKLDIKSKFDGLIGCRCHEMNYNINPIWPVT